MPFSSKRFLCLTDEAHIKCFVRESLEPLVKLLNFAATDQEAMGKVNNSDYDAILYRTQKPSLDDPRKFYQWSLKHKKLKDLPWVILGKDVESSQHASKNKNLRFLASCRDGVGLLRLLESFFLNPDSKIAALDVSVVNPIVNAFVSVLASMAQTDLQKSAPLVKKVSGTQSSQGDILGLINVSSDCFDGSLAIGFQESAILSIYNKMTGTSAQVLNQEVRQSVAELTNIVHGQAKRDLSFAGHALHPASSEVVVGIHHAFRHSVEGACLAIPFESAAGKIFVECVIKPRELQGNFK